MKITRTGLLMSARVVTAAWVLGLASNASAAPVSYSGTVKDVVAEGMPGAVVFMIGQNIPACPGLFGTTGAYLSFAGSTDTNKAVFALLVVAAATGHGIWVSADSSNPCVATQVHASNWQPPG